MNSVPLESSLPSRILNILIFDYDGTLTLRDGVVPEETKKALRSIRDSDSAILGIISGRELQFLRRTNEQMQDVFSFLVAENGAVSYFAETDRTTVLGRDWSQSARIAFSNTPFPLRFSEVICATRRENSEAVMRILKESGLEAKLAPNKDSLMVLPPNVDKGTGVASAIEHYGSTSKLFITCFGDGENDLALFSPADKRVAVSNAVDDLKAIADVVTNKPGGFGILEYLRAAYPKLLSEI